MDRPREPLPTRVEQTAPLPPGYDDALEAGLAALRLRLTPGARAAIGAHVRLLLAWTTAINLTAIRDPAAVALEHVVDSLTAVPILRERGVDRFLDLGSGGGYPGLPIAAALPAARAVLLEPIRKKSAFLSTVATAVGLGATVQAAPVRAEALAADARHRGQWPAVTARAVASLGELVELAFPILEPGGMLVAWKRGDLEREWAGGERAMAAMGGGTLELHPVEVPGLDGHCLVVATARDAAPADYPRDPGVRKRQPW
ncbi:MAG: 16S rRNA (guanine(527)-N(7))-methyltransferase RsmG [Candidatus Limnocylindrales bacterium]|nr:16S rRNA (guanine(527)-N(7))-methyltransferase RsmG [Candidatus Limnocylindrales bacterium]